MTEKALAAIVDEAAGRWDLAGVRVVHRVGEIRPQDPDRACLRGQCPPRRPSAHAVHHRLPEDACAFSGSVSRRLEGKTRWVDSRGSDEAAAAAWEETEMTQPGISPEFVH